MNLLSQTPIEIIHLIDNLRLTYWFAPLVREVMGTERRKVLYNPSLLTEEDIYWITYPFIEIPGTLVKVAEELQIAAREIENLRTNQPNMLKNIQRNLKNIECPTLILWGDKDSWFPVSHGEKLHQNLPNSRLQILRNCYHDAATDSAEVINTAILEFLNTTN
jgi:pimeloyl-ACP methyl ester carboxylesterase